MHQKVFVSLHYLDNDFIFDDKTDIILPDIYKD